MNKLLLILIMSIVLTSCTQKHENNREKGHISNFINITDNEDNGIKEILNFFGGKCNYEVRTSISTNEGTKKYFVLELSQSEVIEKQAAIAQMSASNIAYLFYKNLKTERNNYNEIHPILIFKDGQKMTFKYLTKQLQRVEKRMNLAYKIVSFLKNRQYDDIQTRLNNIVLRRTTGKTISTAFNIDELIEKLKSVDLQLGNITEGFKPLGFRVYQINNDKEILHIAGIIIRDKQSNNFSIDVDLNSDSEEIYLLQYDL